MAETIEIVLLYSVLSFIGAFIGAFIGGFLFK